MFSSFEELEAWKECRKLRQMISNLIKKPSSLSIIIPCINCP